MPEAELRVYAVWMPVLSRMSEEVLASGSMSRATRFGEDERVRNYLDPEIELGGQYGRRLGLPAGEPAWDVWMVFGPEARWGAGPPEPAFWMHQLGSGPPSLRLDGERLAREVERLLEAAEAPARPAR